MQEAIRSHPLIALQDITRQWFCREKAAHQITWILLIHHIRAASQTLQADYQAAHCHCVLWMISLKLYSALQKTSTKGFAVKQNTAETKQGKQNATTFRMKKNYLIIM